MKKKCLFLIVALLVMAVLCACGNRSENADSNENKIVITDEFMEEELAKALAHKIDAHILWKMNDFASKRKGVSTGWDTGVKFSEYETTSAQLTDEYTVTVYGKLYGETVYGDTAIGKFTLNAWCEKDEESEEGYTIIINWGLDSQLTIK